MKRILVIALAVMFCVTAKICADNYSVVLTTYTTASDTTTFAATYPNISGGVKIDYIVFRTTEALSSPILISCYDNCTSTTAAAANGDEGYWVISASPTVSGAQMNEPGTVYPYSNPRIYTNPGFYMKANGTGKKVYMDIQYR